MNREPHPLKQPIAPRYRWRGFYKEEAEGRHPLVTRLSELIERERWSATKLCEAAGVGNALISAWRLRKQQPTLGSFDAVLNVMGYQLCIKKLKVPEPP